MKRALSVFLTLCMLFLLTIPVFAEDSPDAETNTLASVYGIPESVSDTLPEDVLLPLLDSLNNISSFSTEVSYHDKMCIHTTIIEYEKYFQVSVSYSWTNRPDFRMQDLIHFSISEGVVMDNTADGFYTYTTEQGSFTEIFSNTQEAFDYRGHGLARNVTLAKPKNDKVHNDFLFMRCSVYKEDGGIRLNSTYDHRQINVSLTTSLNSQSGFLSGVGITIATAFDQYNGQAEIKRQTHF